MDINIKLEHIRQKMASASAKRKRLEDALKQRKITPEIGDVYLFKLDDVPEDMAVFWSILYKHPEDPKLLFTVPADTDTLIGSLDVAIPEPALYGPLSLRLGRGLWLMESMFKPASRVGIIESLFVNRAQFIMSRIASCEWIGSERQQATDEDPNYEELMNIIDRFYFAMRNYRENHDPVYIFQQVIQGIKVSVNKTQEWVFDVTNEGLEKLKGFLAPPVAGPAYATRSGATALAMSEEEQRSITSLKERVPLLPVGFRRRNNVLKIDFLWLEQMIQAAPSVSMTLRGVEIKPDDISWEDKGGNGQVLKVNNCDVLMKEQEQAKSLLQIRFRDNMLYIDILPPLQDAQ